MFSDFRDFLMRGNVVGLAVAVVIGAAFGGVVNSFTFNVLNPILGLFGLPDLAQFVLDTPGGAEIRYGAFLSSIINFVIVALVVFYFVVKPLNKLEQTRQAGVVETKTTKTCTECASEIPLAARRCPNCTQPQLAA